MKFYVDGYLVNDVNFPHYELEAQDLIDRFIGDDTGAPLHTAELTVETDDGHLVVISIDPGETRPNRSRTAASMKATVSKFGDAIE